jgi:serine-type D-Ala-D-Ala carboxypeptidase (penicillin-binding protein 5/6)
LKYRLVGLTAVFAGMALTLPLGAAPPAPLPPPELDVIPVAVLFDVGSGQQLYAKNQKLRFLPASVTKVMTAYLAFELLAQGKLSPQQRYTVNSKTYRQWQGQGTTMNLLEGESVSVDALLQGLTTVSANDAAIVLAEGFAGDVPRWCQLMNAEARRLGMHDSHFATPNGWPDEGATYVSAADLVKLGEALVVRHPELYRRYFGKKRMTWNAFEAVNHDPNIGSVEGADGIKTGYTREAGYNYLGSAERGGRRLLMVLAKAPSGRERKLASRALIEWGFAAWTVRSLFARGAKVGEARVQGGDAREVALTAPYSIHSVAPQGVKPALALRIVYPGPIAAPIAQGARIAELEIAATGQATRRVPLYAANAVGRAGPFDRLVNGFIGFWS